jgi:hypothetical protein
VKKRRPTLSGGMDGRNRETSGDLLTENRNVAFGSKFLEYVIVQCVTYISTLELPALLDIGDRVCPRRTDIHHR